MGNFEIIYFSQMHEVFKELNKEKNPLVLHNLP